MFSADMVKDFFPPGDSMHHKSDRISEEPQGMS
jgi:hypothetical protein